MFIFFSRVHAVQIISFWYNNHLLLNQSNLFTIIRTTKNPISCCSFSQDIIQSQVVHILQHGIHYTRWVIFSVRTDRQHAKVHSGFSLYLITPLPFLFCLELPGFPSFLLTFLLAFSLHCSRRTRVTSTVAVLCQFRLGCQGKCTHMRFSCNKQTVRSSIQIGFEKAWNYREKMHLSYKMKWYKVGEERRKCPVARHFSIQ